MNTSRISIALAALALPMTISEAALGEMFSARSAGALTITLEDPPITQGTLSLFVYQQDGGFAFRNVLISFTVEAREPPPDLFFGMMTFLNMGGDSLFAALEGVRFVAEDGTWSGGGAWEATGGNGAYGGLTGGGSFTFVADPGTGAAFASFEGDLVPGPGAGALVGLGGVVVGVRRRRG